MIEPTLTAWRAARRGPGTAARVHDLREIVNAILNVCRTGIAWKRLPHDFPPHKTVYDYYAKWETDGTAETVHDLLRDRVRVTSGRSTTPTVAILDSQSLKTSCNVRESDQGIDASKEIKGRKRHIATDVLGLLLAVVVTAASVQDSTVERIRMAKALQDMGFTLDEVIDALRTHDVGEASCDSERWRLEAVVGRIDAKIADLRRARRHAVVVLDDCRAGRCRLGPRPPEHDQVFDLCFARCFIDLSKRQVVMRADF